MSPQLLNTDEITKNLGALLPGLGLSEEQAAISVTGIQNDSRKVATGELFLALPGTITDGGRYIAQAIEQGAAAVLIDTAVVDSASTKLSSASGNSPAPSIEIENLSSQTGEIAARFYDEPSQSLNVIAITGTNGKTSCGRIIAELAEYSDKKCLVIGTTGNGFSGQLEKASHTTPDAIEIQKLLAWGRDQRAEMVSMEVSSHGLEQNRLSGVCVSTAVFTNLTRDHLDYHGSMQSYGDAKQKLFSLPNLSHAVINIDDQFGRELLNSLPDSVNGLSYSLVSEDATLYARRIENTKGICADIETPWGNGRIACSLLGEFNLSNCLAAIGALCVSGFALEKVLAGIKTLKPIEGRMESFGGELQPTVIVDFAHTPDALEKALIQIRQICNGNLICVFGCGGDRDKGKRPLMGEIADRLCDQVILTDDNPRNENPNLITDEIVAGLGAKEKLTVIHDREASITRAINSAQSGDYVLIAGKGHEQTQQYQNESVWFCDREVVQRILSRGDNDGE